jgi:hypothetical protein
MEKEITSDGFNVIYDDSEELLIACAFHRFNRALFDGKLPATRVRWASSIREAAGRVNGLCVDAHPDLDKPHIFLCERLQGLSPLDELVLIHEMCHLRVPDHSAEFVRELLAALERASWKPLVGVPVTGASVSELLRLP